MDDYEYLKYWTTLVEGRQTAIRDYDKAIVTVSAVLLGLTVTLFRGSPETKDSWVLLVAWILLAVNLGSTVLSLMLGYKAFNRQLKKLESNKGLSAQEWDWSNPWAHVTEGLNIVSIVSFTLGLGFLACAAYINL